MTVTDGKHLKLGQFHPPTTLRLNQKGQAPSTGTHSAVTYYLRSSVLGGQVVAEIIWASVSWQWNRGYVYAGSQLLAVQPCSRAESTGCMRIQ